MWIKAKDTLVNADQVVAINVVHDQKNERFRIIARLFGRWQEMEIGTSKTWDAAKAGMYRIIAAIKAGAAFLDLEELQ